MSLPAFSFPFTHLTPSARSLTSPATVTTSHKTRTLLLVGLSTGEISVFAVGSSNIPELLGRLLGHHAPILALHTLTSPSETTSEGEYVLSLSTDGALSKWSLKDLRCVVAASTAVVEGPRGMTVLPGVIGVYACATQVVVVNPVSLETVGVWSGLQDWAIPLATSEVEGAGVVTVLATGEVESWTVERDVGKVAGGVAVKKVGDVGTVEVRTEWGRITGWETVEGGWLVVQDRGLSFHTLSSTGFAKKHEVAVPTRVVSVDLGTARRTMIVHTGDGKVKIFTAKGQQLEELAEWTPPKEAFEDDVVMNVAAFFDAEKGEGKVVVLSRPKVQCPGKRPGIDISVAEIRKTDGGVEIINWKEKALTSMSQCSEAGHPRAQSTCSGMYCNMLAIAHGATVYLYSLNAFLLSYHNPTASIPLPMDSSTICVLKSVRINEYVGAGRNAGISGGKEYLITGTQSGDLFIICSPSNHYSVRLPLFSSAVASVHLLPSNLGRRLRSTLLVSSDDGTACVVDVERARVMVMFPSHEYSRLEAFATKQGRNLLALVYQDGIRREWSMGEEVGGVLVNPPPSRGTSIAASTLSSLEERSASVATDAEGVSSEERAAVEWRMVYLLQPAVDDEEEGLASPDETLQLMDGLCRIGMPSASINVRAILAGLETAMETAVQGSRKSERRVAEDHPAIEAARSLLTALVPRRTHDLFRNDPLVGGEDDDWGRDVGECKSAVDELFFHRTTPAGLGQIGASGRVSMLTCSVADGDDMSPTLISIKLLAVLVLISALLEAIGKKEMVNTALEKMLQRHIGKRQVALGVFAKFWSDANPMIRWVARECLDAFMSALTEEERKVTVEYWRGYLPCSVPPELSSTKEVARSVILLGKLISDYDDDRSYAESLKKAVARSAELLLNEENPLYQDTAIEVIGYCWTTFEKHFDAYSALYNLIRISTTTTTLARRTNLHRCFISIASKNSPLLASSLANNINHHTPASTPTASLTTTALAALGSLSTAAIRIATAIAAASPTLLPEPLLHTIVAAVIKTLDPNSGLREKILPAVTVFVDTLTSVYATVAFHRPTQRLAISAAPSTIVLYDIKSCTTLHVLDGHRGLASRLAFGPDGKCLAAIADGELCVWRFVGGLLSYLGTATTGESDRCLQPKARRTLHDGDAGGDVVWVAERKVQVGDVEVAL